jgi:lysophospholipase L1-like esterase
MLKTKAPALIRGVLILLVGLLTLEAAAEVAYRTLKGKWYWHDRQISFRGMVQPHPFFGACLTASITQERNGVRITHNSFRCRGPEFQRPKPPGKVRIVTLGGSTTYCAGVSDDATWQHFLSQQLGTNYEVINMGAPGGTSVETLAQTALLFSDVQPDIAIYYLGWNDAQVQHVKNLRPDWSDSHGLSVMAGGLAGRELRARTALGYLVTRFAFHYFFPGLDPDKAMARLEGTPDAFTDRIDMRAISLYERNLREIATLCRSQGVQPIFVPQFLNYKVLTSDKPYGWIPFVRDRDLETVIHAYNASLEKVAKEENVPFGGEVLEDHYGESDFIDNGHLSRGGNEKLSHAMLRIIQRSSSKSSPSS